MITKVSSQENLNCKKNSVSFSKQDEQKSRQMQASNKRNMRNGTKRNNRDLSSDQLVTTSKPSSVKTATSNQNNTLAMIAGLGGLGVAGAAIALSVRKSKVNAATAGNTVDSLKKTVQEMSEVIEHLTMSPLKKDFTQLLEYDRTDQSLEPAVTACLDAAVSQGKMTKHELNIEKIPEDVKQKVSEIKTKPFSSIALTRTDGNKINIANYIQNLATEKIYAAKVKPIGAPRNGVKHVVWMPTAEDLKISQNGGLADVPPQMADAFAKHDIAEPVIISPLYKENGTFVRRYSDGSETKYNAKDFKKVDGNGSDLEKLAEYNMDIYTGNKNAKKTIKIEAFQHVETIKGSDGKDKQIKRILLGTDSYFDACYKYNEPTEETERFGAVFSKAIYTFRKLVEDPNSSSIKDVKYKVTNNEEGRSVLKAKMDALKPDATILNDWHVASLAALYRIKAPLEAAQKTLNPKAAEAMMDQNISIILHNGAYQGNTSGEYSSRILNTLFEEHTAGVVENAKINWKEGEKGGSDNVFVIKNEDGSKYCSLAHIGIALSDTTIPVSKHYAKEIASDASELSKNDETLDFAQKSTQNIKTILKTKFKKGNMVGITNGFDSAMTRLTESRIEKLKGFKAGGKDYGIDGYKPYNYADNASIDENLKIKDENKKVFIDWLKAKIGDNTMVLHGKPEHTNINDLNKDNIANVPIVLMGARVSVQKGFDYAKKAVINLMNHYETKYPGKEKPLILIGGPTNDKSVEFLKQLKDELGDKGKRVVAVNGILPNDTVFPVADINMGPSLYEPCGLTQQQALANFAMPVYSDVGGQHDTIRDGVTGVLKPLNKYVDALIEGFDIYHNDKPKYKQMLSTGAKENFDWIVVDKSNKLTGPAVEHSLAIGLKKDNFAITELANAA